MALEQRNGQLYYYRSERVGDKVQRVYIGAGEVARIASESDAISRILRKAERQQERAELERLGALAAPVGELCEVTEILARAHLLAGGYHKHKGEWRRERSA